MMADLLKRNLVSEATGRRIVQAMTFVALLVLLALGGYKLADLELTESQLLLGIGVLFTIALQFAILVMLLDLKRKSG